MRKITINREQTNKQTKGREETVTVWGNDYINHRVQAGSNLERSTLHNCTRILEILEHIYTCDTIL